MPVHSFITRVQAYVLLEEQGMEESQSAKVKLRSSGPMTVRISRYNLHSGEIRLAGYKHAIVQLIAASLIMNQPVTITNVPDISDTRVLSEILRVCGGNAELRHGSLYLDARSMIVASVPEALSQQVHGSLYLLPAYLARFGRVEFGRAGGCRIGSLQDRHERPMHHILSVLAKFGAYFEQTDDKITGYCKKLKAIELDIQEYAQTPTHPGPLISGATKAAILCALGVTQGETRILHPYLKPDVLELLRFAQLAGYNVSCNQESIRISHPGRITPQPFDLISCISEIMTYITLAVHTGIPLRLTNITVDRAKEGLRAELEILEQMGIILEWGHDTLDIPVQTKVRPVQIDVTPTGIFSDHQPFYALMLTHATEPSIITEKVWKDRFDYVAGLNMLGAHIERVKETIRVFPSKIHLPGKTVIANDLRAAAVLVLGALTVPGETIIENVHHLERGYENIFQTLEMLGIKLEVVRSD